MGDSTRTYNRAEIESAVKTILSALGDDPNRPELRNTPVRVADTLIELTGGLGTNPAEVLGDRVLVGSDTGEIVLVRGIRFQSLCEHHLLPFRGIAHIAYLPAQHVVGLSALPRLVHGLAAQPHMQERLGEQIAEAIDTAVSPRGVYVQLVATHGCMTDRGVREVDAEVITVAARGDLATPEGRAEAAALLNAPSLATPRTDSDVDAGADTRAGEGA